MNLYIYSDESGVFDKHHYDLFVFGAILFYDKNERDKLKNKYSNFENLLKKELNINLESELKAINLKPNHKYWISKYLKKYIKFSVVIDLKKLFDYKGKGAKQRYLDYAFKIGLKECINVLDRKNIIKKSDIERLYIYCDEHTIATDAIYDLRNTIFNEFKYGVMNFEYNKQFNPIIPDLEDVIVQYKDSKHDALIRCADMIANNVFTAYRDNDIERINRINKEIIIKKLP